MQVKKFNLLLSKAVELHRKNQFKEAEAIYRRLRKEAPSNAEVIHLLGLALYQREKFKESVPLLETAVKMSPQQNYQWLLRLGLAYLSVSKYDEAETQLKLAATHNNGSVEIWLGLAQCYKLRGNLPEALKCHKKAISVAPENAYAWAAYGYTLSVINEPLKAMECQRKSLELESTNFSAKFGLAQNYHQICELDRAIEIYHELSGKWPANSEIASYHLVALNYRGMPREKLFAEHKKYGQLVGEGRSITRRRERGEKVRVGFLSPDFRNQSCAYFLRGIMQNIPPAVELSLYYDHIHDEPETALFRQRAHRWTNVANLYNSQLLELLLADQLDIIVDLAGHFQHDRLPVLAQRVASVQISYLGYPNTTGVPAMDYRITDELADLPGAEQYHTEKLLRMSCAWGYSPPEAAPAQSDSVAAVVGSFNMLSKVSPETLNLWARILDRLPDYRLYVKGQSLESPELRDLWVGRFSAAGISRVDTEGRTFGTKEHLERYQKVRLSLDTMPYGGTTTICESLWMGVPTVCLAGDCHRSRVGVSLLTAAGHPEWIAQSTDEYIEKVCALVARPPVIKREDLLKTKLFDVESSAKEFWKIVVNT